ncbi:DUF4368 domain-containing protein [Clostridium sp. WCA-389-WT-23D1]|uniref:DUF4368 domain-containing protein n=1 Tax=Clostridium porci TaxID=2605778 RepID=A0A7X2TCC5_9CLOT|nr:DUF4368 domain-containing protein [Clostridium porci]
MNREGQDRPGNGKCLHQDKADFDIFAATIRQVLGTTELMPTIVSHFVQKIITQSPDTSSGHRRQRI